MDSKNVLATKGSLGKNVSVNESLVIDNGEKTEILKTFFPLTVHRQAYSLTSAVWEGDGNRQGGATG